eukprot:TRINITY_DN4554_c4_g1_i1.p1 TRINITY_DN4554_c4_g1~~TRINITY_DN4554_c4_g1_i1.p1  ORF type:complete len:431 (+),score=168.86 TRINITY_DN4554_c4_g1_i1:180-1472(+)
MSTPTINVNEHIDLVHKSLEIISKGIHFRKVIDDVVKIIKEFQLTSFSLPGNSIGDNEAVAIAKIIAENPQLVRADLHFNCIEEAGIRQIAEVIAHHPAISNFILHVSEIGDNGLVHLCNALKVNNKITHLYLGASKITDAGVQHLVEGLRNNNTLTFLDLRANELTVNNKSVAELIRTSKSLKSLILWANNIGGAATEEICKALEDNESIREINFQACELTDANLVSIAKVISDKKRISSINVSSNEKNVTPVIHVASQYTNIEEIGLDDINLDSNLIANMINSNPCLTKISLTNSKFRTGFDNVLNAISNSCISHIEIGYPENENVTIDPICKILSSIHVKYVDMQKIAVAANLEKFMNAAVSNSSLTYLDVRKTNVSCDGFLKHLDKSVALQRVYFQADNATQTEDATKKISKRTQTVTCRYIPPIC